MFSPIAIALLSAYGLALVASYFVVRRCWIRAYPAFVVSFVVNTLALFSFSLVRGNWLVQAVVVAPSMAILFSGLSVVFGMVFRAQVPLPRRVAVVHINLEPANQLAE